MKSRIALYTALAISIATAGAATPAIDAELTDAEAKARKGEATVQVEVTGVELVDPASVQEQPRAGQGHLHYQVNDGPVIATTAPKLSFHGLPQGTHRIQVTLAGNDHKPLIPSQTLSVKVPGDLHSPH